MKAYPVHACTDITGFGLLGHLAEMIQDSGSGVRIYSKHIPVLPDAVHYAQMGLVPGGTYKNREYRECMVDMDPSVNRFIQDVLYDPQTSGGLLISIDPKNANRLLEGLKKNGISEAAVIGEVISGFGEKIIVI